jgi:excisionase family DNA binding protein
MTSDTTPAPATVTSPTWLSLGPASRLLGVDPDTLRRWADGGRIPVYTTPGGHRRFERRALERLASERRPAAGRRMNRPPSPSLTSMGATPERLRRVYRRSYSTGSTADRATTATDGSPHTVVGDEDRAAYRQDGRRLVTALVAYLDADPSDAPARATAEADAATLVDDLARRLAASRTSLTEAVALFVASRRPFLTELAGLGRRRTLDPARLGALYEDASSLLDRLLLRLIATHQEAAG